MIFVQDSDETFVINPQTFERRSVWRCWTGADHMSQKLGEFLEVQRTSSVTWWPLWVIAIESWPWGNGAMGQGSIGMVRSCSGTSLCSHLCSHLWRTEHLSCCSFDANHSLKSYRSVLLWFSVLHCLRSPTLNEETSWVADKILNVNQFIDQIHNVMTCARGLQGRNFPAIEGNNLLIWSHLYVNDRAHWVPCSRVCDFAGMGLSWASKH